MHIDFPFDRPIDDPDGLKPERIQFTGGRPMSLTEWLVRKTREVLTRRYEIDSLEDAAVLTRVIATHANPRAHHVTAAFDQGVFTVRIVPLHSDSAGSAEFELMLALEEAWQNLADPI